jgi:hypothetical protein
MRILLTELPIRQARPEPMHDDPAPERCNALALRQATRHVSQFYDQHLAAFGLKGTQFSIVAKLPAAARARSTTSRATR